ncbi:hypothetical protein Q3G72_019446 [Acer saccharum]|nr:hypothetical protein Q3G72_019446 [Acer saccharum]
MQGDDAARRGAWQCFVHRHGARHARACGAHGVGNQHDAPGGRAADFAASDVDTCDHAVFVCDAIHVDVVLANPAGVDEGVEHLVGDLTWQRAGPRHGDGHGLLLGVEHITMPDAPILRGRGVHARFDGRLPQRPHLSERMAHKGLVQLAHKCRNLRLGGALTAEACQLRLQHRAAKQPHVRAVVVRQMGLRPGEAWVFAHGGRVTALTFLHPGLLAALAAACAPVLIHWIGRRHAPVVYFAAFDFLLAVNERLAARERLRQWLLLLLRTLAVIALVLAVARPSPQQAALTGPNAARRVALIIDTSGSMAYEQNKRNLLEHATDRALEIVSHTAPGDAITLIATGPASRALLMAPTLEHGSVRALLQQLRKTKPQGAADMGQALEQAAQQLSAPQAPGSEAQSPAPVGDIFIISDLARNSFAHLKPVATSPMPQVHLIDAAGAPGAPVRPNTAVRSVQIGHSTAHAGLLERTLSVRLEHTGDTAALARDITLCVDDVPVVRAVVDLPAHSVVDKVLTHTFAGPGLYRLTVRLGPSDADGLAYDDVWFGQLHLVPALRVVAIDGEPRSAAYDDELYFVQRALEAVPATEPAIAVKTVSIAQMAAAFDGPEPPQVCILAHPTHLDAQAVAQLMAFVDGGGGLLITLGSHVDFEQLNVQLKALLPHPLRDLSRAADPGTKAASLGIATFDWTHPVLQNLGAGAEESLRRSRTTQYFNLDTGAGTQARALLRFDNGAPALIEQRRPGAGRVLLWTTSIDVDLSDLPLRTAFVPLIQRSARYLGTALAQGPRPQLTAGQSYQAQLPLDASRLSLVSPSGQQLQAQADPTQNALPVQLGPLEEVGVWTASVMVQGQLKAAPQLDARVNPSLDESDFTPVTPQVVSHGLGLEHEAGVSLARQTGFDGWQSSTTAHTWTLWLLLALAGIVTAESWVAARG